MNNLPVYIRQTSGKTRFLTCIKKIDGDVKVKVKKSG